MEQPALTAEETEALAYFTTDDERYFYALSVLLDVGVCWALSRADDWAWMTIDGQSVFPIWPHAEHAAAYVEGDMEIFPITLEDFETHWLPRLQSTGEGVLVFAVPAEAAVIASADGIIVDLTAERELREHPEATKPYQDMLVETVNAALDAGGDLDVDELLAAADREASGEDPVAINPAPILRPNERQLPAGGQREERQAPAAPEAPTGPGAPLGPGPQGPGAPIGPSTRGPGPQAPPAVDPEPPADESPGRRRRRQTAADSSGEDEGGPPPLF